MMNCFMYSESSHPLVQPPHFTHGLLPLCPASKTVATPPRPPTPQSLRLLGHECLIRWRKGRRAVHRWDPGVEASTRRRHPCFGVRSRNNRSLRAGYWMEFVEVCHYYKLRYQESQRLSLSLYTVLLQDRGNTSH